MSNPNQTFVDAAMPFGSRVEVVNYGAHGSPTVRGTYRFENIRLQRPDRVITRPDEIGGPNGFAIVKGQPTGSATVQWGNTGMPRPQSGDWISDTFDTASSATAEQWVLHSIGTPFEMEGYYKAEASLMLALSPP